MKTKSTMLLSSVLSVSSLTTPTGALADSLPANPAENIATVPQINSEREFLARFHMFNRHVVHLSQLALHQSQSEPVRELARKLILDHQNLDQALLNITFQRHLFPGQLVSSLPDTSQIRQAHRDLMTRLGKMQDSAFDHVYLDAMIRLHTTEEQRLNEYALNIADSEIKAYMEKLRPMMQEHLSLTHALLTELGETPPLRHF